MEDDALSRATTVTDPVAAAAFASSRLRRLLMLFAVGPQTVSEAAKRTNSDIRRLHYHVTRLTRLGLLEVSGIRRRAGRPMKLYRAVSDAFFVPEELFPRPFGDELAQELRTSLAVNSAKWARGLLLTLGAKGEPVGRVITGPSETPQTFEFWRVLRLSPLDFAKLKVEIDRVLRRFESPSTGRSTIYLIHAAAARRKDESGPVDNP